MDRKEALGKIKKCLALAGSSEPHEAAAALRQAQKLAEKYGIEHPELLAADVCESWMKSSATRTPARFEVILASLIAGAFGCDLVFTRQLNRKCTSIDGGYSFIGIAPSPEIASYTYSVLRRQLSKARTEYMKTALKRYRKNKTAAADRFCEGWAVAVRGLIADMLPNADQQRAINAYKKINYSQTSPMQGRARDAGSPKSELAHSANGYLAGQGAQLYRAMPEADKALLLENA